MDLIAMFGVALGRDGDVPGESVDGLVLRMELAVERAMSELAWLLR